jgi:Asp-tRNA(Asn)/Glu-tRNA(Gln) amidotransferase A subunit family amidase
MPDLTCHSALAMAAMVRKKEISPVELLDAHLERIGQLNPKLNAFAHLDPERARQSAKKAESAVMRGEKLGPLAGVPITIKSSIDVAGLRCEAGTKLRAGYVAAGDAPLVARLKAAGAVILGNTNVAELLMAWETDNLLYGRTNNPWDLERTPGGSSGGEAAAIASCCSAGGVGSDGGGSIRVPAHFSGICGLKPTPGRIPAAGHFPVGVGPFALLGVVGPMTRTVADLQAMFEVMAGSDDGDPCAAPVPVERISQEGVKKIHIGFFEEDDATPTTAETRAAVRTAAEALEKSGFRVSPFRPDNLERARQVWWSMFGVAGGMLLGPMLAGHEDELSPVLRQFHETVASEAPHTADSLLGAWCERDELRLRLAQQMRNFPVFICPVASIPAFRHRERSWKIEGRSVEYPQAFSYTQWFNLLGNPAAVVPVGGSPEGLPIGVQIVGRPYEEGTVLAVAAAVEQACGGWQEPPLSRTLASSLSANPA